MSSFLGTDEGENCNTNISSPSFASDSGDKAAACSPTSGCFLHRAAHEASPEEPASDKIVVPVQDRSHSEISDIYATNETDATSEEQPETAEERRIREERESEALAWEMMRQENLEIFRMQMEFMAENREAITDDDYEAIRLAVNESGGIDVLYPNGRAGQLADGENEEYQEEESEEDSQAWDYDRLLELGRTMGGNCYQLSLETML